MLLALVARRQYDQVGGQRFAGVHERAFAHEARDIRELHHSDLAFDDQIRAADVEVVAAATGEVFELPAGSVFAEIELEAATVEPIQQVFVDLSRGFGQCDLAFSYQLQRHGYRDHI